MLSDAISALKWIVDALLEKRSGDRKERQQKWIQVADYLDTVAKLIDATVEDFNNNKIPHGHYSQLYHMGSDFGDVLSRIYAENEKEYIQKAYEFTQAFYTAVHLIEIGDAMVLAAADQPWSREGQQVLADLQAADGRFRAIAATLRATA